MKIVKTMIIGLALAAGAAICGQEAEAYPYNGAQINPPGPSGGVGHGRFWHRNPAGRRGGPGKGWVYNPPGAGKVVFKKFRNNGCYR
ncbi:MAG: hypothetical protein IPG59_19820 [Candidatus Melainabacteria bacterium]|nr:MAG: hypothetical protein IPG59_19820 [Candidatus Melainabacteria bacterium]